MDEIVLRTTLEPFTTWLHAHLAAVAAQAGVLSGEPLRVQPGYDWARMDGPLMRKADPRGKLRAAGGGDAWGNRRSAAVRSAQIGTDCIPGGGTAHDTARVGVAGVVRASGGMGGKM